MVRKGEDVEIENEVSPPSLILTAQFSFPQFGTIACFLCHPKTVYAFTNTYVYLHIHEHTQHMLFCSSPFLIIAHTRAHSGPLRLEATHSTAADVLDCFSWIKLFLSTTNSAAVNILGFESLPTWCVLFWCY